MTMRCSRNRRQIAAVTFAVCALLLYPVSASAMKVELGVSVFGSYNTYQMTDLNKYVPSVLDVANHQEPTGKFLVDEISGGAGFGGGLRAYLTPDVMLCAEYERLLAETANDGTSSDGPYHIEYDVPADAFTLTGVYFVLSPATIRLGLAAGVGYYSTQAKMDFSIDGDPVSDIDLGIGTTGEPVLPAKLDGHGFGFHGGAVADYAVMSRLHLDLRVGLRFAQTTQLKNDASGEVLKNAKGEKVKADWGGFSTRFGFTFLF